MPDETKKAGDVGDQITKVHFRREKKRRNIRARWKAVATVALKLSDALKNATPTHHELELNCELVTSEGLTVGRVGLDHLALLIFRFAQSLRIKVWMR